MSKTSSVGSRRASPSPSEEEETACPLCLEEMDASDCRFKPCPCGYQICRFCWHRIREEGNERCPACRKIYADDEIEFLEEAPPKRVMPKAAPAQPSTPTPATGILTGRKHLAELRVIQKNLVYVIGISARIAHEHILKEQEYFGQFGKILKIVVNRRSGVEKTIGTTTSGSAYVTFVKADEAAKAIAYVDGSVFDGRILRATYGTTKYCSFFLRGVACPNPGCMYLHEEGETVDSYTKEELTGKMHLHSNLVTDESNFRQFGTIMFRPAPPARMLSPTPPVVSVPSVEATQPTTSPINLAQCEDDALSFLSRLSRWNRPIDLDLEPSGRSPLPCLESTDDMTTFDPFAAPVKKRHLWPSQEQLVTNTQSAGRFEAGPMIAKGTLPGFDWSPILKESQFFTDHVVTFKRPSSRPAPVGSPTSGVKNYGDGWGSPSSPFLPSPAPGFENTVASPSPVIPANLDHLFGFYSQNPASQTTHAEPEWGRRVVDATQLEKQFFQEEQPVTPTIPMAASKSSIPESKKEYGFDKVGKMKRSERDDERRGGEDERGGDEKTKLSNDKTKLSAVKLAEPEVSGKKKIAPAPQLPPVIKPVLVKKNPVPAPAPVIVTGPSPSSNKPSVPGTPKLNQPMITRQNHFAVLDDGDASGDSDAEPALNEPGNEKASHPLSPPAIMADSLATPNSKRKKQRKPLEFIHKPMPSLPSQPGYLLEWPSKSNDYTATLPPRFSLMNDTERASFSKWLEEEAKTTRQEEAALKAKVTKMHTEVAAWITSLS